MTRIKVQRVGAPAPWHSVRQLCFASALGAAFMVQGSCSSQSEAPAGVSPPLSELASELTQCPGPTELVVGYDFDYGAKTGIAPPSTGGTCVPGATSAPAGDDYCSANTTDNTNGDFVIRTADFGTATLKYRFPTGSKQENYTIVVDIPAVGETGYTAGAATRTAGEPVATWSGLPSHCTGSGSGITNDGRRLTCNVGTVDATGGAVIIAVPAPFKVSPRALNGERFALQYVESSTGGVGGACGSTAVRAAQALTVSARPNIDLRTGVYYYTPTSRDGVPGYDLRWWIYVDSATVGANVGGEQLVNPLAFHAALTASRPLTGAKYLGAYAYHVGNTLLRTSSAVGDPVGAGQPVSFELYPNPAVVNCALEFLVPGGACIGDPLGYPMRLHWYVVQYFVPLSVFGNETQIDFAFNLNSNGSDNAASVVTRSASGIVANDPIEGNGATYTGIRTLPGSWRQYSNQGAHYHGLAREPDLAATADWIQAPGEVPTGHWCDGGECKQYPSRPFEVMTHVVNRREADWTNTIVCNKFDNRGLRLKKYARMAGAANHLFPSNMPGESIVGMQDEVDVESIPLGYTVQVARASGTPAVGGAPASALNCGDNDAVWVDPQSVTDLSPYNMVRVKIPLFKSPFFTIGDNPGFMNPVFRFEVPANAPIGAFIGTQTRIRTDQEDFGGNGQLGSWSVAVFDPTTNSGVGVGQRIQVVGALVRSGKNAFNAIFGSETAIVGAGKSVTFELSPTYQVAPGVSAPPTTITLVDTLPIPMTYKLNSAHICVGGQNAGGLCTGGVKQRMEPNTVAVNGNGEQVLTWVIPNAQTGTPIPPIYFEGEVPITTPMGTVLTNKVTASAPVDPSSEAERTKTRAVTVDSIAGFFISKKTSMPFIPGNGAYANTLEVANLKATTESNVDLIDVLPRAGGPTGSAFGGTLTMTGPVATTANATVYYTSAAVGQAPIVKTSTLGGLDGAQYASDYAIAPTRANRWCLAGEFGLAGCPAGYSNVTAIRIIINSIAGTNSAPANIVQFQLPLATSGNVENDVYNNRFYLNAGGLGAPMISNTVSTVMRMSSIGGKVFVDTDGDRVADANEDGIAGVVVKLCRVAESPCSSANTLASTVSDAEGNYIFENLGPGTFYVRRVTAANFASSGTGLVGSAGGTAVADGYNSITIGIGEIATGYNFGAADLDDDDDGIPNTIEGSGDADGDGVPNRLDLDADNDGILDIYESGRASGSDIDNNGVLDGAVGKDGIPDAVQAVVDNGAVNYAVVDTDGDGVPDFLDVDSDADGISDVHEANGADSNGDGMVDGAVNAQGLAAGLPAGGLTSPDTDNDGVRDWRDLDSDGDTIADAQEAGDAQLGTPPIDTDGDGVGDWRDLDSDADTISDLHEAGDADVTTPAADTDGDGVADYLDLDTDNDSIADAQEAGDNNPATAPVDSDGDGVANWRDLDSDGDRIADVHEAGDASLATAAVDTDGDNVADYLDLDADNDTIADAHEAGDGDPATAPVDSDGDGVGDWRDGDSDGDAIADVHEAGDGSIATAPVDSDGDGVGNWRDLDTDNDTISDAQEAGDADLVTTPVDTDRDGVADWRDLDTDSDGLLDAQEAGDASLVTPAIDTDGDGVGDWRDVDSDGDGVPDRTDNCVLVANTNQLNYDGDAQGDSCDADDDGDGVSDADERAQRSNPLDRDSDDDGLNDGDEGGAGVDTDGDGLANAVDPDADNDGLRDGTEAGVTTPPTPDTHVAAGNFVPDADPTTRTNPLDADTDDGGVIDGAEDANLNGRVDTDERDPNVGADDSRTGLDADGDGLSDAEERNLGSNPNDQDSDDDGVLDGAEPNYALDTDGDGLVNVLDPDADNDGLFDGTEMGITQPHADTNLGVGHFVADADATTRTNPLRADTDNGGIADGVEDTNLNGRLDAGERDPNVAADDRGAPGDRDADGIPDAQEVLLGSDPDDADSDDDGVLDGAEPNYAADTDGDGLKNLMDPDADNDGLKDGTEMGVTAPHTDTDVAAGNFVPDADPATQTNPLLADTDRGGVSDGAEDANHNGRMDAGERDPQVGADDLAGVDTDGDGLLDTDERTLGTNPQDADSDDDGVIDGEEPSHSADTDGDGLINALDPDSDNDGLYDGTELGTVTPHADTNVGAGHFIPDADPTSTTNPLDADTDDGGVRDGLEDTDRNGRVDAGERDPNVGADDMATPPVDTDGDGLSDVQEMLLGSKIDDQDTDDDGVLDGAEPNFADDTDGDGLKNLLDPDSDGDGLWDGTEMGVTAPHADTNVGAGYYVPDADPSTKTSAVDADSDNGSVSDGAEDSNKNGAVDAGERDPNVTADDLTGVDTDGDGLSDLDERAVGLNPLDPDTDDDGVNDGAEPSYATDTDGDGLINALDPDADNDGLYDGTELGVTMPGLGTDVAAGHFVPDADPTSMTNPLQRDSDNGGVADGVEDTNLNGRVDAGERDPRVGADDVGAPVDSDGDGVSDAQELLIGTNPADADTDDDGVIDGAEANYADDTDGDGKINALDIDSDADGILDGTEVGIVTPHADTDLAVGHYVPDADPTSTTSMVDADSDDGGVPDGLEDINSDGRVDAGETDPTQKADDDLTRDRDGDGIRDVEETIRDTDQDGTRDFLDTDSDNDLISDRDEAGDADGQTPAVDTDGDGTPDYLDLDTDNDGIADLHEGGDTDVVTPPVDTDNDGTPDFRDNDSDGDGIRDADEAGDPDLNTPPVDTDNDGDPDYVDTDADGDHIDDADEAGDTDPQTPPVDTDGDGIPDFQDIDSDGDGYKDNVGLMGGGCAASASEGSWWWLLGVGVVLARRRRRAQPAVARAA